mmetsp:Transcript_5265/g.10772  ORF Transcript_5265/g.10772 Transcript_5265/m.10772 type:complete len:112 (+) Transcript_5265:1200-1535(+)
MTTPLIHAEVTTYPFMFILIQSAYLLITPSIPREFVQDINHSMSTDETLTTEALWSVKTPLQLKFLCEGVTKSWPGSPGRVLPIRIEGLSGKLEVGHGWESALDFAFLLPP